MSRHESNSLIFSPSLATVKEEKPKQPRNGSDLGKTPPSSAGGMRRHSVAYNTTIKTDQAMLMVAATGRKSEVFNPRTSNVETKLALSPHPQRRRSEDSTNSGSIMHVSTKPRSDNPPSNDNIVSANSPVPTKKPSPTGRSEHNSHDISRRRHSVGDAESLMKLLAEKPHNLLPVPPLPINFTPLPVSPINRVNTGLHHSPNSTIRSNPGAAAPVIVVPDPTMSSIPKSMSISSAHGSLPRRVSVPSVGSTAAAGVLEKSESSATGPIPLLVLSTADFALHVVPPKSLTSSQRSSRISMRSHDDVGTTNAMIFSDEDGEVVELVQLTVLEKYRPKMKNPQQLLIPLNRQGQEHRCSAGGGISRKSTRKSMSETPTSYGPNSRGPSRGNTQKSYRKSRSLIDEAGVIDIASAVDAAVIMLHESLEDYTGKMGFVPSREHSVRLKSGAVSRRSSRRSTQSAKLETNDGVKVSKGHKNNDGVLVNVVPAEITVAAPRLSVGKSVKKGFHDFMEKVLKIKLKGRKGL
ncbi:hypothetical protein HDU76_002525 [Blyttiomyces sp. JEL0837]|nr:hypothetical protein HDU76_002525 [Blyttiomyces sp. JEL0837]